jgi:hypothetical protein
MNGKNLGGAGSIKNENLHDMNMNVGDGHNVFTFN